MEKTTKERYENLEQVCNDASLAIITDEINSLRELNKVFVKYRALPKKQKRISNYYSNEFLGHSVLEMYEQVKEKLKADNDFFEELPSEKYAHTEPDLYYKEEHFNSGGTNICFILGHSGSGSCCGCTYRQAQS